MSKWVHIFILLISSLICSSQVVNKIDIRLQNKPENDKQKVVIVFKDQADISAVKNIKGKDAKATFMYNTLTSKANETQGQLIQWLKSNQITYRSYYIVNMISAEANLNQIKEISLFDDVSEVIEDSNFKKLDQPERDKSEGSARSAIWNISQIGAPSVWALGFTGQNVVIGGQDTGYAWEVPTIKSKYRGGMVHLQTTITTGMMQSMETIHKALVQIVVVSIVRYHVMTTITVHTLWVQWSAALIIITTKSV